MARELNVAGSVWQEEFFDHVLRSSDSYNQKWDYVKDNPVRAGLVKKSDDWPFQGEIESLMSVVRHRRCRPVRMYNRALSGRDHRSRLQR